MKDSVTAYIMKHLINLRSLWKTKARKTIIKKHNDDSLISLHKGGAGLRIIPEDLLRPFFDKNNQREGFFSQNFFTIKKLSAIEKSHGNVYYSICENFFIFHAFKVFCFFIILIQGFGILYFDIIFILRKPLPYTAGAAMGG